MLRRVVLILSLALLGLFSFTVLAADTTTPAMPAKAGSLTLPPGDAQVGRLVFLRMQCNHCHMVTGKQAEKISMPVANSPAPLLNSDLAKMDQGRLVTALVNPSHDMPKTLKADGKLSPMGDYTRALSVRDLVDLVAFLQSIEETKAAPKPYSYKKEGQ